jgi:hypothetical protein
LLVDEYEVASGTRTGRPRLKVCSIEEMLDISAG